MPTGRAGQVGVYSKMLLAGQLDGQIPSFDLSPLSQSSGTPAAKQIRYRVNVRLYHTYCEGIGNSLCLGISNSDLYFESRHNSDRSHTHNRRSAAEIYTPLRSAFRCQIRLLLSLHMLIYAILFLLVESEIYPSQAGSEQE